MDPFRSECLLLAAIQAGRPSPIVWRAVRSVAIEDRDSVRTKQNSLFCSSSMSTNNENDQANRAISNGKLHTLLRFHTRPINVVVFHGSDREYSFSGGFPA